MSTFHEFEGSARSRPRRRRRDADSSGTREKSARDVGLQVRTPLPRRGSAAPSIFGRHGEPAGQRAGAGLPQQNCSGRKFADPNAARRGREPNGFS
jgi:hypothetical protein